MNRGSKRRERVLDGSLLDEVKGLLEAEGYATRVGSDDLETVLAIVGAATRLRENRSGGEERRWEEKGGEKRGTWAVAMPHTWPSLAMTL